MKKLLLTLTVAFTLAFGAGFVQAEAIEKWEYSVTGYFFDFAGNGGSHGSVWGTGDSISYNGTTAYSGLQWGNTNGGASSGISLDNYNSGSNYMYTNAGPYDSLVLTHNNQTLDANSISLSSTKVLITMSISDPDSDFTLDFSTVLEVQFFETVNSYPDGDSRNNDIFVVLNMSAASKKFEYDGTPYEISFADPWNATQGQNLFTALPDWAQEYVTSNGLDEGSYYGFVTEEWNLTSIVTKTRIDSPHAPTPEPTSVLLMGAGLAGLGFLSRRRFKK